MTDPLPAPPSSPEEERARRGGPRTVEGKARSASNALRHGLRAGRFFLLPHEDAAEFAALVEELRRVHAPADSVELLYVDAIAVAIWRELRADRLEAEAMSDLPPPEPERGFGSDLGTAGARASLATIVRYRAAAQAEHRRALTLLREHRRLRIVVAEAPEPIAQEATTPPPDEASPVVPARSRPLHRAGSPPRSRGLAAAPDRAAVAAPSPCRAAVREAHRAALDARMRVRAEMARLAAADPARFGPPPGERGSLGATAPPPAADRRAA